jgi:uncharacterized membrane protein YqjE
MSDPSAPEPLDPAPPPGGGRGLVAAGIEALRTRLDLAAVELEIHLLLLIRMLAWLIGALACAFLALAFGITALVVALWDSHRMLGLLGASALFVLLAALLGWLGMRTLRNRPGPLAGSLAQLAADGRRVEGAP